MDNKLANLEPKIIWELFEAITRVPRCSEKEERIGRWLLDWARQQGLPAQGDEVGNVVIRRPPAEGCEHYPALVLQAHMDMVCAAEPGVTIDFSQDPIAVAVQNGTVRALGTTLGADNGIGMAYCLAALLAPGRHHGPLEALFTVNEEAGFTGAFGLKPGFFNGKYLLNLDSEELGLIVIGTAGGEFLDCEFPFRRQECSGYRALELAVNGLAGGHSGVDIHLPRLNAIKVLTQAIRSYGKEGEVRLGNFQGGQATNVIPPSALCTLLIPNGNFPQALQIFEDWKRQCLAKEKAKEPNLSITIKETKEERAYSQQQTDTICRLLEDLPHGPLAFSQKLPGLVETSNNLAQVKSREDGFQILLHYRSSVTEALERLGRRLRQRGEEAGARVKQYARYPGWTADQQSPFNRLLKEKYEEVMERAVEFKAFHFGLEAGVFTAIDPDLQIASIGPTLQDVHTPKESVDVESVAVVWEIIQKLIQGMEQLSSGALS